MSDEPRFTIEEVESVAPPPRAKVEDAESPAEKVLVPMNRCGITIAGIPEAPLPRLLEEAARAVASRGNGAAAG